MNSAGKRIAALVVLAIVAGVGSGVLLVRALDGSADVTGDEVAVQFADAGARATTLAAALTDEQNRAGMDLTGSAGRLAGTGSLPEGTATELREATDRTIASFVGWLRGRDAEVTIVYQPALDTMVDLGPLRSEIDSRPGPGSAADLEYADQIFQRYVDLATPLREAIGEGAQRSTDDPALQQGLALDNAASEQNTTLTGLVRALILAAADTGTLDEQDEIAEVAELRARFAATAETIRATDRSPYREIVEASFPEQLTTDVTTIVDAALAGEPIDFASLTALSDVPFDESYWGLADQAHAETQRHAERLDDDRRAADPEDLLWLAGAALAGLLAVGALVGIFVTASRRNPPVGPAPWPPPPPAV